MDKLKTTNQKKFDKHIIANRSINIHKYTK